MDAIKELTFRRAGTPVVRSLGRPAGAANVHALAVALDRDCPVLLEKGAPGEPAYHVLALKPRGVLVSRQGCTELRWQGLVPRAKSLGPSGLAHLEDLLAALATPPPEPRLPFGAGLVGMLSYDLAQEIEVLPTTTEDRDGLPWLHLLACPAALLVDAETGETLLLHVPEAEEGSGLPWGLRAVEVEDLETTVTTALAKVEAGEVPWPAGHPTGPVVELTSPEDYRHMVGTVIDRLLAGELYQANVSQRFEVGWEGSALALYALLRERDPCPHAGWLRAPGWDLVSLSPERLVRLRDGQLLSQPIKGTTALPLGFDTSEDELARLSSELVHSAKDRAEHVMIVDVHRNDLGRVSRPGSVAVERMLRVDRRRHVLQGVADVTATLREGAGPVDVIRAILPGGCVSGAPRIRAMQVIDELESYRRGPYTGSLGQIASWGDLDLNVLIRSAWSTCGHLAFQAGGGVVLDSDPEAERLESLVKVRSVRDAIEAMPPPPDSC